MEDLIENLTNSLLETITGWLEQLANFVVQFLENTLFNYDGLGGIALDAYNLFVWLGGLLLVIICLITVINQLVSEGEGSQEANIWHTLIGSVKAGSLIVIMPFIISFTMNNLVQPISMYFINLMSDSMVSNVNDLIQNSNAVEGIMNILVSFIMWLFIFAVLIFFLVKFFMSQAQLLLNEILSPIVAVSVVSDNYNFVSTWITDVLSHTVTLIVLTLSIALFAESLTMELDNFWVRISMVIGTGALVIAGPTLINKIKYSSGVGRQGTGAVRMVMHNLIRH